jgi:hypothetical protein
MQWRYICYDKGVLECLGLDIFYSQERCGSFVPFTLLYRSDWFRKKTIQKNWTPFLNGKSEKPRCISVVK